MRFTVKVDGDIKADTSVQRRRIVNFEDVKGIYELGDCEFIDAVNREAQRLFSYPGAMDVYDVSRFIESAFAVRRNIRRVAAMKMARDAVPLPWVRRVA